MSVELATIVDTPKQNEATEPIDFERLIQLVHNIPYIQDCKRNKKRDTSSLSYLITRELSQSDCIKLGIAVEKYLTACIEKFTILDNIRKPNKKGKKEKDILFKDQEQKIIYYVEVKNNLNLDTEKCKSTYEKCVKIKEELDINDYTIKWCLLGARYLHYNDMPCNIKSKYLSIKDNLFGVNQFFELFKINNTLTNDSYKVLLNTIANDCFND